MESYKQVILDSLTSFNPHLTEEQIRIKDRISERIQFAWWNWPPMTLINYYEVSKPLCAPDAFISDWVENADFEADGYDVEGLKQIFQ
jgi:hypothetical protein